MATKAVAAAPEAISEESAKTQLADRPTETQAVVDTTHADGTTVGNGPSVAGASQQDTEHISPKSADNIRSQAVYATPEQPASQEPKAARPSQALDSNASGSQSLVPDTAASGEYVDFVESRKPKERKVAPISRADLSKPSTTREVFTRDAQTSTLTPEQANTLFPTEDYGSYTAQELHNANVEHFREGEHLLGKFTAHLYDRVLPALNESIKRLKAGEEINGFAGEKQVGAYLESVGYSAELVRQWNKRYRDRMAKLKKALGLTGGNGAAKLTSEQRELRDSLMQQGYKDSEATRLAKAAEGNSVIERFNWVMAHRAREISGTVTGNDVSGAINSVTEVSNPVTETTEPPASESVTTVTHVNALPLVPGDPAAAQLRDALANEPDRDVASKLLTEHLRAYANQFANDRIKITEVKVTVEFVGRDHRIMPGDFLEKRQEGAPSTLCKCTGVAEFMLRRRVREWIEGKSGKEHVIFSQYEVDYRVITPEAARRLAPEVFSPLISENSPEGL